MMESTDVKIRWRRLSPPEESEAYLGFHPSSFDKSDEIFRSTWYPKGIVPRGGGRIIKSLLENPLAQEASTGKGGRGNAIGD